jgi:hypothetical protein
MFRRVHIDEVYERRIEDLKTEHARMVKLMADEIEYLRAQLVGPKLAHQYRSAAEGAPEEGWDFMPPARTNPHYTTEEQEEIQALRDGGHIDEVEYRQAMKQLGIAVGGLNITEDAGLPDDPNGFFADDE